MLKSFDQALEAEFFVKLYDCIEISKLLQVLEAYKAFM